MLTAPESAIDSRATSRPPRPSAGSMTKARAQAKSSVASRPVPPRPTSSFPPPPSAVVAKRSLPPPLPTATEPDLPPAWDDDEETDDTEWQDVSAFVAAHSQNQEERTEVRSVGIQKVHGWRRAGSVAARTVLFFGAYVAIDVASWICALAPRARSLLARLHVQWTRASERAR